MQIQVLKQEIKDAIRKDTWLQAELAAVNKVGYWTIGQWRLKDDPMITTATNLAIIGKHLNLKTPDLLATIEVAGEKEMEIVHEL